MISKLLGPEMVLDPWEVYSSGNGKCLCDVELLNEKVFRIMEVRSGVQINNRICNYK